MVIENEIRLEHQGSVVIEKGAQTKAVAVEAELERNPEVEQA